MSTKPMRRFPLRQGNDKRLTVRLRGADEQPQRLPPGTVVRFSLLTSHGVAIIDRALAIVLDDGSDAMIGLCAYDFTASESITLARAVYIGRFDALLGGSTTLSFPDDDSEPLLIRVTA